MTPVLAKLAIVALPIGLIGLLARSSKAAKAGDQQRATLDAKSAAVQAAQVGLAAQLEALAPAFGAPDNAIVGGVAKRIRDKTTLSGFGPNLFDPGGDIGQAGPFKGGPSSGPLRELQGFLLTLQGNSQALVEWSMAMGAQGFVGYAGQLRAKAEGSPVVPLGSGGAAVAPPFVPGLPTIPTIPGVPPGGPITPGSPAAVELGGRIAQAIASRDPAILLALADELAKSGGPEGAIIAERLRQIAKDIQEAKRQADEAAAKAEEASRAGGGAGPSSPGIVPGPAPGPAAPGPAAPAPARPAPPAPPSANIRRRVTVLKGEGPAQVSARLLGSVSEGNRRFRELVAENVPPKKRNKKTGGFTFLNPGEELFVPASWPVHPDARAIGTPPPVAPPVPTVAKPDVLPPAPAVRRVAVKAGEGPFQIAIRLLGDEQGRLRWRELVAANVPPKTKAKDGGFTILNPGELLIVPETWPAV